MKRTVEIDLLSDNRTSFLDTAAVIAFGTVKRLRINPSCCSVHQPYAVYTTGSHYNFFDDAHDDDEDQLLLFGGSRFVFAVSRIVLEWR